MNWIKQNSIALTTVFACFGIVFLTVGAIYDMGVKAGERGALKTAYEVCRKVAPYKDGEGCK